MSEVSLSRNDETEKKSLSEPPEAAIVINGNVASGTLENPQDGTPQDGGWGWVIVFAAMSMTTIIGGSYIGFAILYIEFVDAFHATRSAAGWIGSLAIGCGNMLGIFFGGAVRRFGSRIVCVIGAVITAIGYLVSSLSTDLWHLYLSCGLVTGIGVSMMVVSLIVIVQQYFDKRRPIAVALAVFGYSLGTLIGGPVVQLLLDIYAWRGTLMIIGGIFLQAVVFACLFRPFVPSNNCKVVKPNQNLEGKADVEMKEVIKESPSQNGVISSDDDLKSAGKLNQLGCMHSARRFLSDLFHSFGFSLLADPPFIVYLLSIFFLQLGITVFLQHTPSRAVYVGVERHKAALLPTMSGATTGITRVLFGFVANAPGVNRLVQYSLSAIVSGVIQAVTGFAETFPTIAVVVILESISNGGFYCIQSTIVVDIKGIENVARSQAFLSFFTGIGVLISTPFAGFLFDITKDYDIPFVVSGCFAVVGGILGLVASSLIWLRKSQKVPSV